MGHEQPAIWSVYFNENLQEPSTMGHEQPAIWSVYFNSTVSITSTVVLLRLSALGYAMRYSSTRMAEKAPQRSPVKPPLSSRSFARPPNPAALPFVRHRTAWRGARARPRESTGGARKGEAGAGAGRGGVALPGYVVRRRPRGGGMPPFGRRTGHGRPPWSVRPLRLDPHGSTRLVSVGGGGRRREGRMCAAGWGKGPPPPAAAVRAMHAAGPSGKARLSRAPSRRSSLARARPTGGARRARLAAARAALARGRGSRTEKRPRRSPSAPDAAVHLRGAAPAAGVG
jgi:hypothetical protein